MLKYSRSLMALGAAALVAGAVSIAQPAEARLVCRPGFFWNSYHCVRIHDWRDDDWRFRRFHHVYYDPDYDSYRVHRWHRYWDSDYGY